jgi:activator of HSP90 ATPase
MPIAAVILRDERVFVFSWWNYISPRKIPLSLHSCQGVQPYMAKIGEGDPRWVVREREDGTNVNGWHWSGERDVSAWADMRLRELIGPISSTHSQVTKVNKVEGDANLYTRKAALKVVYDLRVSGEWASTPEGTKGKFLFELFDDEPDVTATMESSSSSSHGAKSDFETVCIPKIRAACKTFIAELMAGANLSATDKEKLEMPTPALKRLTEHAVSDYKRTPGVDAFSSDVQRRENAGKPHEIIDAFRCSAKDLYDAITDRPRLEAVTRAKALSETRPGGMWEVLGGLARGKYVRLEPDSLVVMDWRMKSWDDSDPDCRAELHFTQEDGRTVLKIAIHGLPDSRKSSVEGFWRIQILQAVKVVFGYGSASFL